ncbi:CoA transferase [Dankookia rubra]|uniref:CoA transferase n=1 Tax=Dankookia rubra TaxID=1442381 RepID=A0A4R5QAI6_9PROT|nr:CoA transferase [Dankookia rubra]TDH60072.1 CoA transferase [Dankookia rubra]
MSGPLTGIRVIDLTINMLGPLATQTLGDMGADVIKVEPPDGDPMRNLGPARNPGLAAYFLSVNRNKRSVVLDLKQPADKDALLRLVAGADVLVHSMRPRAAERLGIDYATLAPVNPRLVHVAASGYHKDGPWRDRPAYDDVIQGQSGLAAMNARANGEPRYVPMAMADKLCGLVTASMVAMALVHRASTGQGQAVHVPMFETMLAFNLADHLYHGVLDEPEKGLGYPRMFTPHRRPYATQDGYICLLAQNQAHWRNLLGALGQLELIDTPRFNTYAARATNIDALYAIVAEGMRSRSTAEWLALLEELDVPAAPMNSIEDLWSDPYLADTGFFRRMQHPSQGTMVTIAIPQSFSASPPGITRLPPRLGEHTEEILAELSGPMPGEG